MPLKVPEIREGINTDDCRNTPEFGTLEAMNCDVGRKAGYPTPEWWPTIRARLTRYRFPPTVPLSLLGAWIEKESDGRHDLGSRLGEVGYFQLHPAEIGDALGYDRLPEIVAEIKSSPGASMRWGAWLLRYYDRLLRSVGVPRGTDFYLGMLKAMHWSPQARFWAQHVRHALGFWPTDYATFHKAMHAIHAAGGPYAPGVKRPSRTISCSPLQVLARTPMFPADDRRRSNAHRGVGSILAALPAPLYEPFRQTPPPARIASPALLNSGLGAVGMPPAFSPFPGIRFGRPADGKLVVTSVWADHRGGARPVGHEGIDIPLKPGTPIRAVASGVVWHAGHSIDPAAGIWVGIEHAAGWSSRYMHLDRTIVRPGQRVSKGEIIGGAGDTGAWSGTHLHFNLLLRPERLMEYAATYGVPASGWGRDHGPGVAVPAEPLIPVDGYTNQALARIHEQGIKTRPGRSAGGAIAVAATLLGIAGLGVAVWFGSRA